MSTTPIPVMFDSVSGFRSTQTLGSADPARFGVAAQAGVTVHGVDSKWMTWRMRQRVPGLAVPVPAQDLYDEMIKLAVSPVLRKLGFTGSGSRYTLKTNGCWSLLGLQKSVYSDGREVRFTANLLVAKKQTWTQMRADKPYLPERPSPGTLYGGEVAQSRLGPLLPSGEDTWWRVYDAADLDAVARDLLSGIEHHGLPWLREQMARQGCA